MRRSPEQEKLYNEWAKNRVFNPVEPSFEERHKVEGQAEQYITILRELSEVLRDMDAILSELVPNATGEQPETRNYRR